MKWPKTNKTMEKNFIYEEKQILLLSVWPLLTEMNIFALCACIYATYIWNFALGYPGQRLER